MKELDPGLKRLLEWARTDSAHESEEAPFGFSGRVVASLGRAQSATLFQELQRTALGLVWGSIALVICGGLVLLSQRATAAPGSEISSVLNFIANNLL
jgi:hypothetical protein